MTYTEDVINDSKQNEQVTANAGIAVIDERSIRDKIYENMRSFQDHKL